MDNEDLLATIVYEANSLEKFLLVQNSKTNKMEEFAINDINPRDIRVLDKDNNKIHSLNKILSDNNLEKLETAKRNADNTSFILSKSELKNLEKYDLVKGKTPSNSNYDNKELLELKETYRGYALLLKEERKEKIPKEETVIERLTAGENYNEKKREMIKKGVPIVTLQKMEKHVEQQLIINKQNSISL